MPVIDIPLKRINKLINKDLTLDELEEYSLQLGADIDDKREDGIKVEYNPNRPDYCSIAGFARAVKGIADFEIGLPKYALKNSGVTVKVEKSVSKVRPFIQCAIVRNVSFDANTIAELMNTQETLHWVIGRDRKKVSIGIHDMRDIQGPFRYFGVDANTHAFLPLGEETEMTPKQICTEHPKGIKYAHLVNPEGIVPFLVDKNDGVLSFPPIINGVLTLVSEKTTDLFIDATGTEVKAVKNALEILTSSFAEEGYQVETVTVEYPDGKKIVTPTFANETWILRQKYVKEILGLDLTSEEIEKHIKRSRFGISKVTTKDKQNLSIEVPSFRVDILHEVDLIEDIAISYGYHLMEPILDDIVQVGEQHPVFKLQNRCRDILAGLGFIEVVSWTLVSKDWHYKKMRTSGNPVELLNPVSREFNIFRDSLIPSLMNILQKNKPFSLPQKIFDVGDISHIDEKLETSTTREIYLSGVIIHSKVDFVEIKSNVEAILKAFGVSKYKLDTTDHPSFFEGRCAKIMVKSKKVGVFGEIHPEVLNNFELENPVGAFEIEVEKLL